MCEYRLQASEKAAYEYNLLTMYLLEHIGVAESKKIALLRLDGILTPPSLPTIQQLMERQVDEQSEL